MIKFSGKWYKFPENDINFVGVLNKLRISAKVLWFSRIFYGNEWFINNLEIIKPNALNRKSEVLYTHQFL